MTALSPLVTDAHLPATGVEIRPLDDSSCVISRGEVHHVVGIPAATATVILTAWRSGREDLLGEDVARAVRPLRALLADDEDPGLPSDPPPHGPLRRRQLNLILSGDDDIAQALTSLVHPDDGLHRVEWPGARALVNQAYATRSLLVVAVRGARESDLIDIDRMCHDMRVNWLPLELTRGRLWIGPLVTPGRGASYEDAAARRLAAARDSRVHRALRTPAAGGDQGPHPAMLLPLLDSALDVIADASQSISAGVDDRGDVLHELWSATSELQHRRHPVLPMPHRLTQHRAHTVDDLVDDRTGVIVRVREVTHDPVVPDSLVTRQADVGDIRSVSPWANNVLCQGSAVGDASNARLAALGESAERYCGNILDALPVTWASHDELRRRGVPALDPVELVLYSDAQYRSRGFPFEPFTRSLRVHWVPGRRIGDDAEILVPASLVYVNWYSAGFAAAPPVNFCAFAGIAAGPSEDFAVASAIEEIIERHATMVWWLNAEPLPGVDGVWVPELPERLRHVAIRLDNEFGVPVAASVIVDDVDELVNVGFSARPSFDAAVIKALTEAFTLQEGSRDLLRSNGLHWKVMADGELNGRAFKPWRADRRYLDDFREDMHDCDDLMVQQQVWLDPRSRARVAGLLEPSSTIPSDTIPGLAARSSQVYREALEAAGISPIVVDITTGDIRSAGLSVVRVIAPGTIGNAPAAFPFLGRSRVRDLAVELGWRDTPLPEADLNYFPLPHA